jgi:hypothetical protein
MPQQVRTCDAGVNSHAIQLVKGTHLFLVRMERSSLVAA